MNNFLLNVFLLFTTMLVSSSNGFVVLPSQDSAKTVTRSENSAIYMGNFFENILSAFDNNQYGKDAEVTARHILCAKKEDAEEAMAKLKTRKGSFEALAKEYSKCPSAAKGGSLGSFKPGVMVPDFDEHVFDPTTKVGEVAGPVMTPFGYHLIVVDKRTGEFYE